MSRVAIVTDSNSGISMEEARERDIYVIPMPFFINGKVYYESVNLSQEEFYQMMSDNVEVSTSMPSVGDMTDLWEKILKIYDELVYIPMSSGLSSGCATAAAIAEEYEGRVRVVDAHRVSVPMKDLVFYARHLVDEKKSAFEIKEILEKAADEFTVLISVETLKYLKKGGRITPAVALIGTALRIRPVLEIHDGRLDTFAKCRTMNKAKQAMIDQIRLEVETKFGGDYSKVHLGVAYTGAPSIGQDMKIEMEAAFPGQPISMDPLPLSIACHTGPGAVGIAWYGKLGTE